MMTQKEVDHIKFLFSNYFDKIVNEAHISDFGFQSLIILDKKIAIVFSMNDEIGGNIDIDYYYINSNAIKYKSTFAESTQPVFKQALDVILGFAHLDGVLEELQFKLEELILKEL
jgi:hypothetical protein